MKKLSLIVLALITSVTATFAASSVAMNWRSLKSIEEFDAKVAKQDNIQIKNDWIKQRGIVEYILATDFTGKKYETVKAELKNIVEKSEQTKIAKLSRIGITFIRFPKLHSYFINMINDEELIKIRQVALAAARSPYTKTLISTNDYRKILVKGILKCIKKDVKQALMFINSYEEMIQEFKNEDIIADMKEIKKFHYSKIAVNEEWKKLLVKVELISKSVQ